MASTHLACTHFSSTLENYWRLGPQAAGPGSPREGCGRGECPGPVRRASISGAAVLSAVFTAAAVGVFLHHAPLLTAKGWLVLEAKRWKIDEHGAQLEDLDPRQDL